jgi:hypothetical protein
MNEFIGFVEDLNKQMTILNDKHSQIRNALFAEQGSLIRDFSTASSARDVFDDGIVGRYNPEISELFDDSHINSYFFEPYHGKLFTYENQDVYTYNNNNSLPEMFQSSPLLTTSKYGSIIEQSTLENTGIRQGKEIILKNCKSQIKINGDLISFISKMVAKHFGVYGAECVPDKLLFYKRGDFFKPHKDSPSPRLFATVIIFISQYGEGNFKLYDSSRKEISTHGISNMVGFFTDMLHEVKPIQTEHRESLTFKIYAPTASADSASADSASATTASADSASATTASADSASVTTALTPSFKFQSFVVDTLHNYGNFGILLENTYTIVDDNSQMKGNDLIITTTLKNLNKKFKIYPVVVRRLVQKGEYYGYDDTDQSSASDIKVYNLSKQLVDLLKLSNVESVPRGIYPIYVLCFGKCLYENVETEEDYYIGNSYEGYLHENIYLNHLLVVYENGK